MRVTHVEDNITHAIIGGATAIDFGISDNPEFFNILSSTLYKNQKLAVVRETLCNAWDAHIEADKTDVPIKIKLTSDELSIEDFGPGIPHDKIGPIYGTYGNSTKKNDGRATGGFGLGCKAPFAYTDHFEVISSNGGVATIYNLSKSNAEVGGKPGIIPITNYPCDVSGLKVTIPINEESDLGEFHRLIMKIVKEGGMLAEYENKFSNSEIIPVIPYEKMQDNYLISHNRHHPDSNILVRYGNVLYPVSAHERYAEHYDSISRFLLCLQGGSRLRHYTSYRNISDFCIIFQAEPDSLVITPSREEVSMQEHTINTLTKILADFNEYLDKKLNNTVMPVVEQVMNKCVKSYDFKQLFHDIGSLPYITEPKSKTDIVTISDAYYGSVGELNYTFVRQNYPSTTHHYYKEMISRINALIKGKYTGISQLRAFKKFLKYHMRKSNTLGYYGLPGYMREGEFFRIFLKHILNNLGKNNLPKNRLMLYNPNGYRSSSRYKIYDEIDTTDISVTSAFSFLKRTVIIAYNKTDVDDYLCETNYNSMYNRHESSLIYMSSKNYDEKDAVRNLFHKMGYVVYDLTTYHDRDKAILETRRVARTLLEEKKAENNPTKQIIPEIKGFRTLYSYSYIENYVDYNLPEPDHIKRIEDPECVIRLYNRRANYSNCPSRNIGNNTLGDISALFGDRIAVVDHTTIYNNLIKNGKKPLDIFLRDEFEKAFYENSQLIKAISLDTTELSDKLTYQQTAVLRFIINDPFMSRHYGINTDLSSRDHKLLHLWKSLQDCYGIYERMVDLAKAAKTIKQPESLIHLVHKLSQCSLVELLDTNLLPNLSEQIVKNTLLYGDGKERLALIRKILLLILKG